ncbi:MAG: flagellar hook capping FlgD N-terminal domain-containing protein [Hylemonella sp.]|nr:flagellar hook capping FlgD N-terminal domain-containing protein [Hylemonella sp.]
MVASVSNTLSSPVTTNTGGGSAADVVGMQDRFLKLLVAQINNQDPLNPMDNAQMTSQMAQINTVSGIQQVNQTLQGLASQFTSMQVLQATNLVGHDVLLPGSALTRDPGTGLAGAAFDLAGNADQVKIEILSPAGNVMDTIMAGALGPGRHSFGWDATNYPNANLSYRITATSGKSPVSATPYSLDQVQAVGASNGTVTLDMRSGKSVAYASVAAFL